MSESTVEGAERSGQRLVSFFEKEPKRRGNDVGVDLIPFADYDELVAQDKLNERVPTMDATCEAVLRLGQHRGRVEIRSTSQFDIDGELAKRLKKARSRWVSERASPP